MHVSTKRHGTEHTGKYHDDDGLLDPGEQLEIAKI